MGVSRIFVVPADTTMTQPTAAAAAAAAAATPVELEEWTMERVSTEIDRGRPLLVVQGTVLDLTSVQGGPQFVSANRSDCALFSNFTSGFSAVFGARSASVLAEVQQCAVGLLSGSKPPLFSDEQHPAWQDSPSTSLVPERPPRSACGMARATDLLFRGLSSNAELAAGAAVLGAIVGDAAAVPNHWCYDLTLLASHFDGVDEPEFFEPGVNPYYTLPAGVSSCYGDQMLCALESLTEPSPDDGSVGTGLDTQDLCQRMIEKFSEDSHYGTLAASDGVLEEDMPVTRGYRHGSVRAMVEGHLNGLPWDQLGSDDPQVDCCVKIIPVCAAYAGDEAMLEVVEDAIRLTQDNDEAVTFGCGFARVLEACILGSTPIEAIDTVSQELRRAGRSYPQPDDRFVATQLQAVSELSKLGSYDAAMEAYLRYHVAEGEISWRPIA